MARTFLGPADGEPSVLGLCNLLPVISRHSVWQGPGFRWHEVMNMVLSYFPSERSGEVWKEANASASLTSQLSFLRVSAFQKQNFSEAELLVCITAPFGQSASHRNPLERLRSP